MGAEPAKADGAAEAVAVRAAWLAEAALTAVSAFVDLGRPEGSPSAQVCSQGGQVSRVWVELTEPVGVLSAGRRAVACAGRDGAGLADRAIPVAPMSRASGEPRCLDLRRRPETYEDKLVAAAGWTLWGS